MPRRSSKGLGHQQIIVGVVGVGLRTGNRPQRLADQVSQFAGHRGCEQDRHGRDAFAAGALTRTYRSRLKRKVITCPRRDANAKPAMPLRRRQSSVRGAVADDQDSPGKAYIYPCNRQISLKETATRRPLCPARGVFCDPSDTDVVNGTTTSVAGLIGNDGGDGISLREAIIATNNDVGADEIILPAATFLWTIDGDSEANAATGDLDIQDDVTIRGAGSEATRIDANMLERVLDVVSGTVVIEDVTLQGGDLSSPADSGGGLKVQSGTNITLTRVLVEGNVAGASGGGIDTAGALTLVDLCFRNRVGRTRPVGRAGRVFRRPYLLLHAGLGRLRSHSCAGRRRYPADGETTNRPPKQITRRPCGRSQSSGHASAAWRGRRAPRVGYRRRHA